MAEPNSESPRGGDTQRRGTDTAQTASQYGREPGQDSRSYLQKLGGKKEALKQGAIVGVGILTLLGAVHLINRGGGEGQTGIPGVDPLLGGKNDKDTVLVEPGAKPEGFAVAAPDLAGPDNILEQLQGAEKVKVVGDSTVTVDKWEVDQDNDTLLVAGRLSVDEDGDGEADPEAGELPVLIMADTDDDSAVALADLNKPSGNKLAYQELVGAFGSQADLLMPSTTVGQLLDKRYNGILDDNSPELTERVNRLFPPTDQAKSLKPILVIQEAVRKTQE